MNKQMIEDGARLILQGLDVDLTNHNFATTPARVAKVYEEMFCPKETGWPTFAEDHTDMVILRSHKFYTMCPHHMLPVKILAAVAYIPNGHVIGASKLARMLHECNRKPETQEALTDLAVKSIKELTRGTSKGEAVLMQGKHGCFEIRGIRSDAEMITHKFSGEFLDNVNLQNRFFQLVGGFNGK